MTIRGPWKLTVHPHIRGAYFGINGYTISSAVLNSDLNGDDIASVPLETDETMQLGYLTNDRARLSPMAARYLEELRSLVASEGYDVLG